MRTGDNLDTHIPRADFFLAVRAYGHRSHAVAAGFMNVKQRCSALVRHVSIPPLDQRDVG